MKVIPILGIDIAKRKFDVCLRPAAQLEGARANATFDNNLKGVRALLRWLDQHQAACVHACLEATSRYGEALALFLHQHQHQVSVVNPRRIHHYAGSRLVRTQNDQVDAGLIADFCASEKPRLWEPMADDKRQLQDLVRTRGFLVDQKQQCANRLETEGVHTRPHLRQLIGHLEKSLAKIEKQLAALLQERTELARQVALVDSIIGVGLLTAAVAVAELPPIGQFEHAGQAVAFAGLDPRRKTSGDTIATAPRQSKMGSRLLRKALYMAALCALRKNPIIVALGQRLAAKGKTGKLAVGAAMRKLLRLIFGVLKSQKSFDPNWEKRDRAVDSGGRASGGDGLESHQLASPPVATA
jgi:transposase